MSGDDSWGVFMQKRSWMQIAEIFSQLTDLPEMERAAFLAAQDLSEEDRRALDGLIASQQHTGFLHTGGAIAKDLQVLETGDQIGNWRVLDLVGTGGMGEVYRVERADGHYDQIAALKRISLSDGSSYGRFERERQILAQLEHSGIARLIDGGVDEEGAPFFVMELIEGQSLLDYARQHALSTEQRLRFLLKVCAALAHAHGRLVLHRDLKPSNIMVTPVGDVKLIDFGVAGLLSEAEADLNAPMTRLYAAPEQIEGKAVSVATDVFGLGKVMQELLTGKPPETDAQVSLPADLQAIIRKATAQEPSDRYASVDAFSRDVERYLSHFPVDARAGGAGYHAGLFLRRNVLAVSLIAVLFVGFAGTFWQYLKAETERDVALSERERLRTMQDATFVMFADAASDQEDTPMRTILTRAADKVQTEFSDNPQEVAPVLHMFGEMFYLINDYPSAEPILRTVASLPPDGRNDDIIARGAHDLATVLLRSGKADEARVFLDQALAIWNTSPERYADQLIGAEMVRSQLAADAGDPVEAEAIIARSVPRRIALSGENSTDTAILLTNLGVARMRTGDFPGAIEASKRARDAFLSTDRLETPDGLNAMNNLATLYHMTGRLEEAESAYQTTLDLRRSLYGPSAALAVLISNYGKLKLQSGEVDQAVALFDEAMPMANEFGGAASPPAIAVHFGLIEALAEQGDVVAARDELEETGALLTENDQMTGAYAGLFELAKAQVAIAANSDDDALAALADAETVFTEMGPAGGRYLAKVTQTRGRIEGAAASSP